MMGTLSAWVKKALALAAIVVASIPAIGYAEIVHSVSDTSYDSSQRPLCTTRRMNPATWSGQTDACIPQLTGANGPDRVTKTIYDRAGQVLQVRRAVGTPLEQAYATYAYSANGKQTTVVDANGNRADLRYDGFDRQTHWIFPSNNKPVNFDSPLAITVVPPASTSYFCSPGFTLSGSICTGLVDITAVGPNNTCPPGYVLGGSGQYYSYCGLTGSVTASATYTCPNGYYVSGSNCSGETALLTAGSANQSDYEQYGYDANGNRTSLRKRDGSTLTYSYDALNRVTVKVVPERAGLSVIHSRDIYYQYDLRGLMISARFDNLEDHGVTNTYNGFGELTSSQLNLWGLNRTLSYKYDLQGKRTELTHAAFDTTPEQKFTYARDTLGRVSNIYEGTSQVTTAQLIQNQFDNRGLIDWMQRATAGNAFKADFDFDPIGRLASTFNDAAVGTANDLTISQGYNPASQIISQTRSNDAYSWTGAVAVNRAYSTNGLNQYTAAGPAAFTYDANGNLTSDGSTSFVYDIENRLVSASGVKTATLVYDPMGRLFQVMGTGTNTRFLYDGDELAAEYDSAGTMARRYVHSDNVDDPVVQYNGAAVGAATRTYLMPDERGSIAGLFDNSGNAIAKNTYDEYGIPGAANQGRFQYTGQAWIPELGMYYYKARIYSPTLGRFLQVDPIGYDDQINLYAYVGNDPVNGVDPDGLQSDMVMDRRVQALRGKGCEGQGAKCAKMLGKGLVVGAVGGVVVVGTIACIAAAPACAGPAKEIAIAAALYMGQPDPQKPVTPNPEQPVERPESKPQEKPAAQGGASPKPPAPKPTRPAVAPPRKPICFKVRGQRICW